MSRYTTELIWPPFKGKAHKVVDTATGTGIGLYRTAEGARRKAKAMNEAPAEAPRKTIDEIEASWARSSGQPVGTFRLEAIVPRPGVCQMGQISVDGVWYFAVPIAACPSCGQTMDAGNLVRYPVCPACVKQARAPQGEAVRLFEPAPTQLAGQLSL